VLKFESKKLDKKELTLKFSEFAQMHERKPQLRTGFIALEVGASRFVKAKQRALPLGVSTSSDLTEAEADYKHAKAQLFTLCRPIGLRLPDFTVWDVFRYSERIPA
jgi:hypothetical protein